MTQQEIALLLEMMLNAYPMAANKITNPEATIQAWELAFGDEPSDRVYKAARHHMNTSKFFPTVADIRQAMNKGQLLYGDVPEGSQRAIEAPQAPHTMIPVTDNFCDLCGLCDAGSQEFCPCDF